jgi:hypothetical protein
MHQRMSSDRQRDYAIRVHLPRSPAPAPGHPVIWLLDVPTTWAPMQHALHESGADDTVVIGIGWDDDRGSVDPNLRRRDFTLPARHDVPPPRGGELEWREDGDGEAFLRFLTGTLQPHYLDALPLDPRRQTLVGHSLSGLFVLQALVARPQAFARYVAASPSIWWDRCRLMQELEQADWQAMRAARVLLSVGSEEQTSGPEKPEAIDGEEHAATLGELHMIGNASGLGERLRAQGVDCRFELFEGEGHRTVLPAAMATALEFARLP